MMDGWIRALVEAIHAVPFQATLYFSGGASQALGWLLSVPGASSNTVLEAVVPYSRISMAQVLGIIPTQFAGQQTVEELSLSYNRALKLSKPGLSDVGKGFTGSLASAHSKRGEHSAFVIGADTAARLINPKYYGGDYINWLQEYRLHLVDRRKIDGIFKVLEDFDVPDEIRDMFIPIPPEKFNMDISSTEIRKSRGL